MNEELKCNNCDQSYKECTCWDDLNIHQIIVDRYNLGLFESKHLDRIKEM